MSASRRAFAPPAAALAQAGGITLLALLPFHLVLKDHLAFLPLHVSTWWKDGLALAIGGLAVLAVARQDWRRLRPHGALDAAVLAYCAVALGRAALDLRGLSPLRWGHAPAAWGVWMDLGFVPLYCLGRFATPGGAARLRRVGWWTIIATGIVCAVGAIVEGLLGRALFPSAEHLRTFGYAEIYVYATHIVRPYVTFDHPVALGAYLAVAFLALAAWRPPAHRRAAAVAAALGLALLGCGLVLTYSRGPWVGTLAGLGALVGVGLRQADARVRRADVGALAGFVVLLLVVGPAEQAVAQHHALSSNGTSGTAPRPAPIVPRPAAAHPRDGGAGGALDLIAGDPRREEPPQGENAGARHVGGRSLAAWTIGGRTLPILFEHPPQSGVALLQYGVVVPPHGVLAWSIAMDPRVWDPAKGDGVLFQIALESPRAATAPAARLIFSRYIDPKNQPGDRRWFDYRYPLRPYRGRLLLIDLLTSSGPAQNSTFDWAGWGAPHVRDDPTVARPSFTIPPPTLPIGAPPAARAAPYVATVADWQDDESNKSRLRAWRVSLTRWRSRPLLGTGLGTTDEIAVRFAGDAALITESQPLKALVESGPAGLASWLLLMAAALAAAWRGVVSTRHEHPAERWPLAAGWTALVCIVTVSLTFQLLEIKQIAAVFWFVLGLCAAPLPHCPAPRAPTQTPPAAGTGAA